MKGLHPELRSLWHHRNDLSLDDNGIIWRKRSSQSYLLLLIPKSGWEDADLIPIHSGEDWVAQFDDDLSQPTTIAGDSFLISTLQREDPICITLHSWISSGEFPPGLR